MATVISGFRAGVLWFAGYTDMAVEWANRTSQVKNSHMHQRVYPNCAVHG
jgi:hypothetical protein